MQIAHGLHIQLHFSLSLADGTEIESSFDDQPVSFTLGDGTFDKGLELALIGLRAGDRQTLTLMPGQAFGMPDPAAVQSVPVSMFPVDMAIEAGVIVGFSGPEGEENAGTVMNVSEGEIEVDFNHPLAGQEIVFRVEILAVASAD